MLDNPEGTQDMDQSLGTQLQTTLNTVPAFTWYSLPSGTLTFVNHRYADYLGLASDHPLRFGVETGVAWDTHLQLLHPDDHESSRAVGETILRTGGAGQAAFRVRDAGGVYRWFLSRVEPFRASDGTVLCFIGINLDIEDRKRVEEALRRNEHSLAEAQRLSHVGSVGMQVSTKQIFWSEESARIYGYAPGTDPTPATILRGRGMPASFRRQARVGRRCVDRRCVDRPWADRHCRQANPRAVDGGCRRCGDQMKIGDRDRITGIREFAVFDGGERARPV